MGLDWRAHTCSYYCTGTTHAVPVLAQPETPPAVIAAIMQLALDPGDILLEIRPAREADVGLWRTQFAEEWTGWSPTGRVTHRGIEMSAQMSVPYLALIRRQSDIPDGRT